MSGNEEADRDEANKHRIWNLSFCLALLQVRMLLQEPAAASVARCSLKTVYGSEKSRSDSVFDKHTARHF